MPPRKRAQAPSMTALSEDETSTPAPSKPKPSTQQALDAFNEHHKTSTQTNQEVLGK